MKIVCDIDGVLSDIVPELIRRLRRDFNITVTEDEINKFELPEALSRYNIRYGYILKMYSDEWFWSRGRAVDENISWLQRWSERGHEVHIVTARPRELIIVTKAWLKKYSVSYRELFHVRTLHKHEYLKEIQAGCIFEDMFFEANRCAIEGFPAFVVRRPYNAIYEERVTNRLVTFIDDFSEADDYICERKQLK